GKRDRHRNGQPGMDGPTAHAGVPSPTRPLPRMRTPAEARHRGRRGRGAGAGRRRASRLRGLDHRLAGGRRTPPGRGGKHRGAELPAPRGGRRGGAGGQAHLVGEAVRAVSVRDVRHRGGGRRGRGQEHDRAHVPPRPGGGVRQGAHRCRGARGDHALQGLLSGRLRRRPQRGAYLALQARRRGPRGARGHHAPHGRYGPEPSRPHRERLGPKGDLYPGEAGGAGGHGHGPLHGGGRGDRRGGERGLRGRPPPVRERRQGDGREQPNLHRPARQDELRGQRHARRPLLGLPAPQRARAVPDGGDGRPGLPHRLRGARHGGFRQLSTRSWHLDGLRRPEGRRGRAVPLLHSRRPPARGEHPRHRLDHAGSRRDGPLLRHGSLGERRGASRSVRFARDGRRAPGRGWRV
ncbi:MAG: Myo-inositol 2-dehydrogenase, partial [uncultured Rubrobacteraceae bacterium]